MISVVYSHCYLWGLNEQKNARDSINSEAFHESATKSSYITKELISHTGKNLMWYIRHRVPAPLKLQCAQLCKQADKTKIIHYLFQE